MWISTFHSCCVRILRKDINKIGYNRSFVIYDSADQVTLVKDCLKELNLSDKVFEPKAVISAISGAKDKLYTQSSLKISTWQIIEWLRLQIFMRYIKTV